MSNLGEIQYSLALEVYQWEAENFLNQQKYTSEILKKFRMQNCKTVRTLLVLNTKFSKEDGVEKCVALFYRNLIGSLLYLSVQDIIYCILPDCF